MTIDTSARSWPELTLDAWADTLETVHRWTQVVGKVRLALEPSVNHWWQIAVLRIRPGPDDVADARRRSQPGDRVRRHRPRNSSCARPTANVATIALQPRSVAGFYDETMGVFADLAIDVDMLGRPVEIPDATPFAEDTAHAAYDREAIRRFWQALVEIDRLFDVFRGRFIGKASPVHFFWGAFDLATTRFSGRTRTAASRRRAELCGLGDARGVQPRSEQLRILARR